MIQDIFPKKLNNQYHEELPSRQDTLFFFEGSSVLARQNEEGDQIFYPSFELFCEGIKHNEGEDALSAYHFIYLFSIDDKKYFLAQKANDLIKGTFEGEMADSKVHSEFHSMLPDYQFIGVNSFRKAKPKEEAFAAITAYHLYTWYRDNQFCGRCGQPLTHDHKQRMLKCSYCNNMIFPKISPAVIVGVINQDKILLTKYAGRTYKNYALIAGFTEIGETPEETVQREVMEEVGVKVKNIIYYKSQPWALSGSLLLGYFCELDGDDNIHLDHEELSLGTWLHADEIDFPAEDISLTNEMIMHFKKLHSSQPTK
ncbi:MAG: NAD(+) diphosphatase [Lachnospiraceae bacterium]